MISCHRARAMLVEHVRGAVGEAALFQLDQHLAACAECQVERARWQTMRALRDWQPTELTGAARARIAKRLAEARPAQAAPTTTWPRSALLLGVATAAAAAALVLAGRLARPTTTATATATVTRAPTVERHQWDRPDTLQFAGAELAARAGTVAELRPATRSVALVMGELDVNARISAAPLRIASAGFLVLMAQAHAVFAADSVRVLDGEVRVYSTDERLLATLAAGQSWPAAPARASAAAPAPASAAPSMASAVAVALAAPPAELLTVDAELARARTALANGEAREARRWIQRALAGRPSTHDRAEAELFVAESYLVEQQPARALAAYQRVADSYARLPEGEAAAFAAAQVLYEKGTRADARAAFGEYLTRYPDGRFAREARDRINAPAPSLNAAPAPSFNAAPALTAAPTPSLNATPPPLQ